MEPVKVKVYGLFAVTKSKYIAQLIMALVLIGVLFYVWGTLPRPQGRGVPPQFEQIFWLMDQVPYLLAVILVLLGLEAFFVLRAFARKEAAQRAELEAQKAQTSETPPPPAANEANDTAPPGAAAVPEPEPLTPPS